MDEGKTNWYILGLFQSTMRAVESRLESCGSILT